jgi:creatinine amidohydrolase
MSESMLDGYRATWRQAEAHIGAGCIAVLPFGAFEQHGPHMPLSTDTIMASGLARRLAAHFQSILLPPLHYGETWNNEAFPGTVSLSFETVRCIALDICQSLSHDGVLGLVVVNGDFGNQAPLKLAARQARERLGFPVMIIDYPGLAEVAADICETGPSGPGFYHADEVETSIVLALEPATVDMGKAAKEYPVFPVTYGSTPIPLRQVSTSGVFGDPRRASAEKGERMLDALTARALSIMEPFVLALPQQPPTR